MQGRRLLYRLAPLAGLCGLLSCVSPTTGALTDTDLANAPLGQDGQPTLGGVASNQEVLLYPADKTKDSARPKPRGSQFKVSHSPKPTPNGTPTPSGTQTPTPQLPTITAFNPAKGAPGVEVTITGTNFSTSLTGNTVLFKDKAASVTAALASEIKVKVPAGATTGTISVKVGTLTAVSANSFEVTAPPTISDFTPKTRKVGEVVTITGSGFSATKSSNTVKFFKDGSSRVDGIPATAAVDKLEVVVPSGAATGKFLVVVDGAVATSAVDLTIQP